MKIGSLTLIGSVGFITIALGLFALNFWHASKCGENHSTDEMTKHIETLKRRLLQAESQVKPVELKLFET